MRCKVSSSIDNLNRSSRGAVSVFSNNTFFSRIFDFQATLSNIVIIKFDRELV